MTQPPTPRPQLPSPGAAAPVGAPPPGRWLGGGLLTGVVCVLLTLVATSLSLPGRLVAVAPAVLGVVVSVQLLLRLRTVRAPGRVRVGPATNLAVCVLLLLGLGTQVLFYGAAKSFDDCISGANTSQAQAQCHSELQRSLLGSMLDF